MTSVTDHVVVPFDRNSVGDLVPGEAAEAPSADAARRRAQALVGKHAGAVAFSRTGCPGTSEFQEAELIAEFGEVDRGALQS